MYLPIRIWDIFDDLGAIQYSNSLNGQGTAHSFMDIKCVKWGWDLKNKNSPIIFWAKR